MVVPVVEVVVIIVVVYSKELKYKNVVTQNCTRNIIGNKKVK